MSRWKLPSFLKRKGKSTERPHATPEIPPDAMPRTKNTSQSLDGPKAGLSGPVSSGETTAGPQPFTQKMTTTLSGEGAHTQHSNSPHEGSSMIGSSDTPKSPASALDARSTDDPTDQATSALRVMSSKDILTAQPTTSPEKASIYLSKEVIHAIQDHRKDDVLIAVIGTTDLGLDEFIGSLTHSKTGEGSAASKLRTIRLRNHSKLGNRLLLLVPPCLDGTLQSEQQALAEIQKWIDNTYPSDNVKFQGICYLHSITTQSLNSSLLNPDHEQPFNDDPALKRVLVVLYGDSDVLKCLPTIGDITNAFEARGAQVQLLMKNNGPAEAWGLVNRLIEVGEEADCSALNTSLANLEQELKKTSQGIIVLDLISKSLSSLCSAENDTKTRIAQYSRVRDLMENKVLTTPMVLDVHAGEFFTSFFTRKASDVHPESDKDHDQHYAMVLEVLDDAKLLETLQKLKDSETAQSMTDFLATMFDNTSSMSLHNKKAVLQTLDILANSVNVYPKWLEINGVKKSNKRVGGGAYADVWHADYGEEKVCVKVIRHSGGSELLKAHYREMILWAHVSSPNILPFLGIYFSNEEVKQLCIVLPWMERGNLLKYLKNVRDEKRTPPRIPLLHDVVSGLQYLHSLGIVHGDIKGENILVSKTERAMLADFGSSRFETATQAMGATQSPGSLAWMAPERFLEIVQSADTQSDAWSFGCLCYEVLTTGMQPFQQYNGRPSVLRKDFHEKRAKPMKPELKDNWDKEIWSLVESCCVYEPNSRPTADTLEIFIANFNCPDERLPDSEMPSTEKTRVTPNYRSIDRILRGILGSDRDRSRRLLFRAIKSVRFLSQSMTTFDKTASQVMIDFLYEILSESNDSELASRDRDTILRLLGLFGEFSQTLPAIFQLQDLVNLDLTMPLAEGGHGIIYKAIYKNQIICVKAVRMYHRQSAKAELAARAREIGLAAHLSHSNILPFLGSAVSSEKVPRMCFVFPWMENGNLVRYLKVHPEIHRIPLLHDIISALGFLHQNGIVHGSLKASKVLVSETGHAILADFIMSSRDQFSLITDFSNLSISVNWMAPELLVLKPRPTHASDIWAFGCVCYEVLTGLIPFHEYQTIPQVIRAVIKQEVPSKPSNDGWDELSEKAWSLMEECWKYGSDQRPNSEQLRDALSKFNLVDHRPSPMSPAHWVKKDGPKIDYARVIEILHEVLQSATTEP